MKRIAAALVTTAALVVGTLGLATLPAQASSTRAPAVQVQAAKSSRGEVTRSEFRRIKKGMSVKKVRRIVHAKGKVRWRATYNGSYYYSKTFTLKFRPRSAYGYVWIDFEKNKPRAKMRVTSKSAYWG